MIKDSLSGVHQKCILLYTSTAHAIAAARFPLRNKASVRELFAVLILLVIARNSGYRSFCRPPLLLDQRFEPRVFAQHVPGWIQPNFVNG